MVVCLESETNITIKALCGWANYQTEIVNFLYVGCIYTN